MSDIDTATMDSLKALDPNRPIREATNAPQHDQEKRKTASRRSLRNWPRSKYSLKLAASVETVVHPEFQQLHILLDVKRPES